MMMKTGAAVITYKAKHHLSFCLPPLLQSCDRVLVVNSSSNDGTVEKAQEMGADTLVIPRGEFNHGLTREKARRRLGTDIVLMVTPDAYAADSRSIEKLVLPIKQGKASISYARQIPHAGAGFFESFARAFNYPEKSHVRGIEDIEKYGVYTFFCSDAFCAWKNSALDEIGGFESVLVGEDTVAASKLIHKGHKIAYVSDTSVRHSHSYTLVDEFKRHFDTGLAREGYRHLLSKGGSDTSRGRTYVKKLFAELMRNKTYLIPYAVLHICAKLFGYQTGKRCVRAPLWLKKALSSQDFYWK